MSVDDLIVMGDGLVSRNSPRATLPEVNAVIRNSFGARIGHGDLVLPKARVLIENDGAAHWDNDRRFAVDIRRLDEFMEGG
ncbi:MAG: hypothetical protein H7279_04040 [Microbacteriaceae bacterium]|nr:hypothetical protein [Microbacteriaceae bacterium]